jgi:ribosomal protein S18 acetylase RimI-like enzyme
MKQRLALRQGSRAGFDAMLETLTDAFTLDPLWGGWAFTQRELAQRQRRVLFGSWLEEALDYGCVLASADYEAVAMWYPPSATRSAEEERGKLAALATALSPGADRCLLASERLEVAHPRERPHFYLCLLGTHPQARGQKLGQRLLEGSLELLDAARMPAYLDSTNPINLRLYEALQFRIIGHVQLPDAGPRVDLMWREPAGADWKGPALT